MRISQGDGGRPGPLILLDDDLESLMDTDHRFIVEGKQCGGRSGEGQWTGRVCVLQRKVDLMICLTRIRQEKVLG